MSADRRREGVVVPLAEIRRARLREQTMAAMPSPVQVHDAEAMVIEAAERLRAVSAGVALPPEAQAVVEALDRLDELFASVARIESDLEALSRPDDA